MALGSHLISQRLSTYCIHRRSDWQKGPRALPRGFTLIEMLVVITILGALAGLVITTVNIDGSTGDAETIAARATMQTIAETLLGSAAGPGYLEDMRYVPGFKSVDLRLNGLLAKEEDWPDFDPNTRRGWRGPYLRNAMGVRNTNTLRNGTFPASDERRNSGDATFLERKFYPPDASPSPYGNPGDLAVADPWGNPIVVQVPPVTAFGGSASDAKRFRYARLVSAGVDGELTTRLDDRLAGMQFDGSSAERGDDLVLFLNRSDIYEDP